MLFAVVMADYMSLPACVGRNNEIEIERVLV